MDEIKAVREEVDLIITVLVVLEYRIDAHSVRWVDVSALTGSLLYILQKFGLKMIFAAVEAVVA